jgi:hypothetical protein
VRIREKAEPFRRRFMNHFDNQPLTWACAQSQHKMKTGHSSLLLLACIENATTCFWFGSRVDVGGLWADGAGGGAGGEAERALRGVLSNRTKEFA